MKVRKMLLTAAAVIAAGAANAEGTAKFGYFNYSGNDARFAKQIGRAHV